MSSLRRGPEIGAGRDSARRVALPLLVGAGAAAALVWGRPWTLEVTAEELVMGLGMIVLLLGVGLHALARRPHPRVEVVAAGRAAAPLMAHRRDGRVPPPV